MASLLNLWVYFFEAPVAALLPCDSQLRLEIRSKYFRFLDVNEPELP